MLAHKFYLFTIIIVIVSFLGSFLITYFIKKFSIKYNIVDDPESEPNRKRQKHSIPLLGGSGFAITSILLLGLLYFVDKFNLFGLGDIVGGAFWREKVVWIILAVLVMIVGGFFDDKYHLSPKYQLFFINIAVLITIFFGGIVVQDLSKPFEQFLPNFHYLPHLITYVWLMACIAATKFLDGHDGLVASVGIIGLFSIASVSLFSNIGEPLIFLISLIWASGIIGFLPFNFPNAKIYLGEGASEVIGYTIGVLAILSGAKIVTAGTVIGYFIIDLIFVWFMRLSERRNPLTSGDRLHWHHRLVDLGMDKIQVLVVTTIMLLFTTHAALWISDDLRIYFPIWQFVMLLIIFAMVALIKSRKN